tara:strand:- start:1030 stop:1449 length:420 start_codon:yes stop_codon:yes gene_type:complete
MDCLPYDIIWYINEYLYDYEDLLNLKITCKSFDKMITAFSLGKLMLAGKFINYKPIEMCINIDCYDDTWDIYEDVYHAGYRHYIHSHQPSLNQTNMIVNRKQYKMFSPYCSECFMKYVLIGDKKNVTHNLIMDQVNIEY